MGHIPSTGKHRLTIGRNCYNFLPTRGSSTVRATAGDSIFSTFGPTLEEMSPRQRILFITLSCQVKDITFPPVARC